MMPPHHAFLGPYTASALSGNAFRPAIRCFVDSWTGGGFAEWMPASARSAQKSVAERTQEARIQIRSWRGGGA